MRLITCVRSFVPVVLAAVAYSGALHAQPMPLPVSQALSRAQLPEQAVSMTVQEIGKTANLVDHLSDAPRNPASVMKLVTTYAALEKLGPAYTWETAALSTTAPVDGKLATLYVRGTGDPSLTTEKFWMLLRQLKLRGVKEIGDVVLDRSVFAPPVVDPAKFDGESLRVYNVPQDALLLSFRATQFQFLPDAANKRWAVTVDPPIPGMKVVADVKMAEGECGFWRANLKFDIKPAPAPAASFGGSIPTACNSPALYRTLYSPNEYFANALRQLWQELGGSFKGKVSDGVVPAGAQILARVESAALAEAIRPINKNSMNVSATQVFLTLAVKTGRVPATLENAEVALREVLAEEGLKFEELRTDNGSGLPLGRGDRLSTLNTVRLLQAAAKSAVMPEFVSSLSVMSMDGTSQRRLKNTAAAGQAHVKTGTLNNVRSLAGYVLSANGKRYAFAITINHGNAAAGENAMYALVNWIQTTL